jgi:hypothetical protein
MQKKDFEEIFKKGFKKKKIYYENALKGESELQCFKCGAQAGLIKTGTISKKSYVLCINNHKETLIRYTSQYVEMEHDLLNCKLNSSCDTAIKSDYKD